jgi:hypothetical protein
MAGYAAGGSLKLRRPIEARPILSGDADQSDSRRLVFEIHTFPFALTERSSETGKASIGSHRRPDHRCRDSRTDGNFPSVSRASGTIGTASCGAHPAIF